MVVNKGGEKVYGQRAYRMDDEEKRKAELKPFALLCPLLTTFTSVRRLRFLGII